MSAVGFVDASLPRRHGSGLASKVAMAWDNAKPDRREPVPVGDLFPMITPSCSPRPVR